MYGKRKNGGKIMVTWSLLPFAKGCRKRSQRDISKHGVKMLDSLHKEALILLYFKTILLLRKRAFPFAHPIEVVSFSCFLEFEMAVNCSDGTGLVGDKDVHSLYIQGKKTRLSFFQRSQRVLFYSATRKSAE